MSGVIYLITLILVPWLVAWTISDPAQSRGTRWPFDMKEPAPANPLAPRREDRADGPISGPTGRLGPRTWEPLGPRTWGRPGRARKADAADEQADEDAAVAMGAPDSAREPAPAGRSRRGIAGGAAPDPRRPAQSL